MVLVYGAIVTPPTGIRKISPDRPLEETLTPFASELTVVLARALVPADHAVSRCTRGQGLFLVRTRGARVVIVEDIVTTGLSIRETITCLKAIGADVIAAACIIDRSAGKADVGVSLIALAEYEVPAYSADNLPPELQAIPPVKPGSRNI